MNTRESATVVTLSKSVAMSETFSISTQATCHGWYTYWYTELCPVVSTTQRVLPTMLA